MCLAEGGCAGVLCPRIMNDKDIIDNDCWEGWWVPPMMTNIMMKSIMAISLSLCPPGWHSQCPLGHTHYYLLVFKKTPKGWNIQILTKSRRHNSSS